MDGANANGWSLLEFLATVLLAGAASMIGLLTGHKVHEGELKNLRETISSMHAENVRVRKEDREVVLRLEQKLDRAIERFYRRDE